MKKALSRSISLLLVLVLALAGCGGQKTAENTAPPAQASTPAQATNAPAKEPVVLSFGCIYSEKTPTGKAVANFIELVSEKTNGEVEVQYYPSEQLGTEQEMVESVGMGAIDITLPASAMCGLFAPSFLIFPLPYVVDDWDHLSCVMDSELGAELSAELEESVGCKVLANNWFREPRYLYGSKPVNTLADLKGFRVRVPETPTYVKGWERLGASPTPMALGEVYTALQTGALDGAETTISYHIDNGFSNVAPYFMKTSHVFETNLLIMNQAKFESLTPEQQQALVDAGREAGLYHQELVQDGIDSQFQWLEDNGSTVIEVDRENWIKQMDGLADEIWEIWGDQELYGRIRSYAES